MMRRRREESERNPASSEAASPSSPDQGQVIAPVETDDFAAGFGESLSQVLDLDTWHSGEDLALLYQRLVEEVESAVQKEEETTERIRAVVFPRLSGYPSAPRGAGVHRAELPILERIHRGLLFNGGVEACDGNQISHDTLPLSIYQIGISLVSYQGDQGTWVQRLFRRDLRVTGLDPTEEALELLETRERRGGLNQVSPRDQLAEIARRGILAYAERAILLRKATRPWRMGHGNPAPAELIAVPANADLMIEGIRVVRELVEGHQKFLFVPSEPSERLLLTIGNALHPCEYAIVGTLRERMLPTVERTSYHRRPTVDNRWDGVALSPEQWIRRFVDTIAPKIVVGVYRASALAGAQVFYAHEDHADLAAHIAIADSILQEHRGFPLLVDLADRICSNVFGAETIAGPLATAYATAGAPFRYHSERATRR